MYRWRRRSRPVALSRCFPPALPTDVPEALASDASIDALLRGVRDQLSDASSWSVREPRRQDTTVVVARASRVVPTAVEAAARAAGLPFRDVVGVRDAVAECTVAAITQYLSSAEHPFFRGLPAVLLRRRLQCRHAGNGSLELVFPGSVNDVKAALPSPALVFNLDLFVVSRLAAQRLPCEIAAARRGWARRTRCGC